MDILETARLILRNFRQEDGADLFAYLPEERRRRAEERKGSVDEAKSNLRSAERKRRRYPLAGGDLPPLERVVGIPYGLVVFTEITEELVEPEAMAEFYPGVTEDHVRGVWRKPTIEELRPGRRAARRDEDRKLRNNRAL